MKKIVYLALMLSFCLGFNSCSSERKIKKALYKAPIFYLREFNPYSSKENYYRVILKNIRVKAFDTLQLEKNFNKGDTLCFVQFTFPRSGTYLRVYSPKIDKSYYLELTDTILSSAKVNKIDLINHDYRLISNELIHAAYEANIEEALKEFALVTPPGIYTITLLYYEKNKLRCFTWDCPSR